MSWKITTLIENHPDTAESLICENGFSLLIENEQFKMLMDTGKSGAFYDNALKMGESLTDLDCVMISHGHYDHAGGLMRMMEETGSQKKLYVGKGFFDGKYCTNKEGEKYYNGIQFERKQLNEFPIIVEEVEQDCLEIAKGVRIHRNFEQIVSYEHWNPKFFLREEEQYVQDTFSDEMALTLDTKEGLVVIVGCSHPGIVNILKTIVGRTGQPIRGVIGGTHLMDADKERLLKTMEDFKAMGMEFIGVSHCTGDDNLKMIQESFGEYFIFNCTGNIIKFD